MSSIDRNWADEEARSDYWASDFDRDLPDLRDVIDDRDEDEGAHIRQQNSWGAS